MKNTKICPKCGNSDIVMVPGKAGSYGVGNNIQMGLTNLSAIMVNRHVCCSCGFSEEWIEREDLPKLKKKFGEE